MRSRYMVPVILVLAVPAWAAVIEIPPDWSAPPDLSRCRIAGGDASSTFDPGSPTYSAGRAFDGDRRTKWVAAEEPNLASPQWLRLRLASERRVRAVAVFGERVDNDGIIDGQVQALDPVTKAFRTVAEIRGARSSSWLARFDPVKTTEVRLLVTRSGPPSPHTDVYEVEVFAEPRTPPEVRASAERGMIEFRNALARAEAAVERLAEADRPAVLNRQLAALRDQYAALTAEMSGWDRLAPARLEPLAAEIEAGQAKAARLVERLERLRPAGLSPQAVSSAPPGTGTAAASSEHTWVLESPHVTLTARADGAFSADWRRPARAQVRHAQSSVRVDGRELLSTPPEPATPDPTQASPSSNVLIQKWPGPIEFIREIVVGDAGRPRTTHSARASTPGGRHLPFGGPFLTVSGRLTNRTDHNITIDSARLLELSADRGGWWYAGHLLETPAAVWIEGLSTLLCQPAGAGDLSGDDERSYAGTGVLCLVNREPTTALVIGFATGREARPDLAASFRIGEGGRSLVASQIFHGRRLAPGETLALDTLYLAATTDPYAALEQYADAVAAMAEAPVRAKATSLWCSWYAHRMAVSEDLVLANAAVIAKHFQPLGMKVAQIDHGWQAGNITGDWVPNERFPHGLQWLANELRERWGLELGLWIAPTDVAATSATFRDHPDWTLKDDAGRPRVNWRWYWAPNPDCFELDASHPDAERWIAETFARLTAAGARYYKIDFIAAAGGDHFRQHDAGTTRGWGVLRRAMRAVRQGAGEAAYIRYCQAPPLLAAGLADAAYGGDDTLDAGLGGKLDVLRSNARSLAASWWIHDRLYHREVCDMSVRMQADVEEVRLRLAMMTLAGCSISFSDELQYLPPSRIRMMQQCLPPGGPPMRPLDLLDREIPSLWHIPCRKEVGQWHVVGLFNWEDRPEERTVDPGTLGLPTDADLAVLEFWTRQWLGLRRGPIAMTLPPQTSRILLIRPVEKHPMVVGTDMHLLGGWHELTRLAWNAQARTLSGECRRAAGLSGRVYVYVPPGWRPHFEFPLSAASARLTNLGRDLWAYEVEFTADACAWSVPFDSP